MDDDREFYSDEPIEDNGGRLRKFYQQEAHKEAVEHRDMLLNMKAILETEPGKNFIQFLLKSFDVGELPKKGVEGNELYETLGFLRAGQSVFQMVSQANDKIAGQILASIEREKYARINATTRIEQGQ